MEKKGRSRAVTIFENTNDKMSLEEYKKLEREREELEKEQAAKIAEENKKLVEDTPQKFICHSWYSPTPMSIYYDMHRNYM